MYSIDGNYTLRYSGNILDIAGQLENLRENKVSLNRNYKRKYLETRDKEKFFLEFLNEYINIEGIELYKINDDGTIEQKTINNDEVDTIPCE